jgi:hypothetical protein
LFDVVVADGWFEMPQLLAATTVRRVYGAAKLGFRNDRRLESGPSKPSPELHG